MRAYCAHTSHPNTKETDALPVVEHNVTVKLDNGKEEVVCIEASDPGDAISKVNAMDEQSYKLLRRVI